VVFGITLSTLHQSALGALYMMAKPKIHPLWYSEFIPVLFFVSSIYAGLCMVIFEGGISHRVFRERLSPVLARTHDSIIVSLARIAGGTLFVYLFLEVLKFLHGKLWLAFSGGWAAWYLVEVVGFGAVPMVLLLRGSARKQMTMIKTGAIMGLCGALLNRLNISVIAFKWNAPVHYVPSWMEIVVSASVICAEIWVFRWVVMRMPILADDTHEVARPSTAAAVAQRLAS
jgi:Ni/Fe-hydrogenase subunit HybB-like protein